MVGDLIVFWILKGLIGSLIFVILYILIIIILKWITK